jgi:hypothetical protein
MSNTFVDLPVTAANAPGTAVDVSAIGAAKTIVVKGNGTLFEPYVLIEYSNDDAQTIWTSLVQFTKPGTQTVLVAARYMRATVKNYTQGGAPTVSCGGCDETVQFAELVAPAGNGQGAAVDTSALPGYKTIQVSGTYKGVVNIEVSTDAGVTFATIASFGQGCPQTWSGVVYAEQMRISRSGMNQREPNPGTPVCDIAATLPAESAGGGGAGGAGVIQWTIAKTWADVYAEILAMDGPKIVLVEYDPNAANGRNMTAEAGGAATDLNDCYFWAWLGGRTPTPGDATSAYVRINLADGFLLMERSTGNGNWAFLRSKDIYWRSNSGTAIFVGIGAGGTGACFIDMDGGRLEGFNVIVQGSLTLNLKNNARITSLNTALFQTYGAQGSWRVRLASYSLLAAKVFFNASGIGSIVSMVMDPSCQYNGSGLGANATFGADITANISCPNIATKATGEQYQISISAGGALQVTAV